MKTIGILGGIAPESTIEYYRQIISSYQSRDASGNNPQIVINSINMKKMLDMIADGQLPEVAKYLAAEIGKLEAAGADFALLASNTPHIVFDQVQRLSPLALISIVEETSQAVISAGLQRVGLMGTKFTMQGGFYQDVLAKHAIEIVIPAGKDQTYVHDKYMGEFVKGVFLEETKAEILKVVNRMKHDNNLQGLILGGTELPFILQQQDVPGIQFFDTTEIHVQSALRLLTAAEQ